jgi:hypothetical protein
MEHRDHDVPPELLVAARQLRDHRPEATMPEIERIKRRALARAGRRPRQAAWELRLRSRTAIATVLALGGLMTGAGAGLAVSGISSSGSAGIAEFGPTATQQQVLGTSTGNTTTSQQVLGTSTGSTPTSQTSPTETSSTKKTSTSTAAAVQASRQVESNGAGKLPFTGYTAIPILLVGISLLVGGVLLRRRAGRSPAA